MNGLFKIDADMIRLTVFGAVIIIAQYLTITAHMNNDYAHLDEEEYIAVRKVQDGFPYNEGERKIVHDTARLIDLLSARIDRYEKEGKLQSPIEKMKLFEEWAQYYNLVPDQRPVPRLNK